MISLPVWSRADRSTSLRLTEAVRCVKNSVTQDTYNPERFL